MNRFLLALPALLLWGCSLSDIAQGGAAWKKSDWLETGETRKPREEVVRHVRELLTRQGFTSSGFENNRLETEWDEHPSPRWREGYRTKLEVRLVTMDSGAINVLVQSTMEINNSQHGSIEWIGAGASERHKDHIADEAIKFQSMMKMRLFGLNQ